MLLRTSLSQVIVIMMTIVDWERADNDPIADMTTTTEIGLELKGHVISPNMPEIHRNCYIRARRQLFAYAFISA